MIRFLLVPATAIALAGCITTTIEESAAVRADASVSDASEGGVPRKDGGILDPCAFLGDPARPPEIQLTILKADGSQTPLNDGDMVPLLFPPQGGRVIFVGARATNIHPCGMQIVGKMRDEQNGAVRNEARVVDMMPAGDGWAVTGSSAGGGIVLANIASVSNITLCPNSWSASDVYGQSYELTVSLKDSAKLPVTKTIHVKPACAEPARVDECKCICARNYVLGQACNVGVVDAGADG